jgi:hypothetical protein
VHKRRTKPPARYPDGWVPIQFPTDIEKMFIAWKNCKEPNIGWCLLCNQPIRSVEDLLPGTDFHNCEANRNLPEATP